MAYGLSNSNQIYHFSFAQFNRRLLTERRLTLKLCNDFDSCNAVSFSLFICRSFFPFFLFLSLFRCDFVPTPIIDEDDVVVFVVKTYFIPLSTSINLSQSNKRVSALSVTDIFTIDSEI